MMDNSNSQILEYRRVSKERYFFKYTVLLFFCLSVPDHFIFNTERIIHFSFSFFFFFFGKVEVFSCSQWFFFPLSLLRRFFFFFFVFDVLIVVLSFFGLAIDEVWSFVILFFYLFRFIEILSDFFFSYSDYHYFFRTLS